MRSLVITLLLLSACGGTDTYLSKEELMKPETCMQCHADHYTQWSGSMHAYAANDPVFLAMNARGQKATNGALGDFCVTCHAPMALKLQLTTDGTNLDQVPQYAKGVTCYFCHTVEDVTDDHNNPLTLADDDVLRGGIVNPVASPAHRTARSPYLDSHATESASMCGACHDVRTPAGVHLERTFAEWKTTIFGQDNPRTHLSCGTCHMFATDGVVTSGPGAVGLDVPLRPLGVHEHTFAGIDTALTDWPEKDAQRAAIDRDLGPAIGAKLCVSPADGGRIEVTLDDRGAGHNWPSGAAQDRRAWVEIVATDATDKVVFSSGVVADDQDPEDLTDPNLWVMHDKTLDANGQPAHFFWDVATVDMSRSLPPAVTTDISDPRYYHAVTHNYPTPGLVSSFAKVQLRVLIRPLPHAMLNDLISGGELNAADAAAMPTIELTSDHLVWTSAMGTTQCAM
ncbi:MAG TPA: multiheme c-type cytochrome [Kofleriaceae bacterium]|nr:multiheme c-type cytochrome [Kofleriaceae bacterium]